jgi:excisionase family DNA binding protein
MMNSKSNETVVRGSREPLLDSHEAAALLGIHPKTLQRMVRQGQLPGSRLGRKWLFRASELDDCIRPSVSSKRHS